MSKSQQPSPEDETLPAGSSGPTVREALAMGYSELHANPHLRNNALRDATYLLRHGLGISSASMIAHHDRMLTREELAAYRQRIARRYANEPVQYILGEQEFYGLTLRVNSAVLIPRSATEHLVEAVLEEFSARTADELRIVDVGTGSGAIAIALARHLPGSSITALDLSAAALEVASSNAELHGVADRVRCLASDLLAAVAGEPGFDAIVSNPPYIATSERDELHPEIRDFEPDVSLYGGPAGLDVYRRLIPEARNALRQGGLLALEIGRGQRDAIAGMLADWETVRFVDDLQGIPRVALARKP
jgi:release factor glutamine methyltransferase